MSFTIFQKGTTISADEVNANFYWVGQGDWLPRSGVSLTADVTGTLDVGSDVYRWNDVYCNNVDTTGYISKSMVLVAEVQVTVATTQITVSGLDGNTDVMYEIISDIIHQTSTAAHVYLSLNRDTAANYGFQFLAGEGVIASSGRGSDVSIRVGYNITDTTTSRQSHGKDLLYAKSGNVRADIQKRGSGMSQTYCEGSVLYGFSWNNTADNITQMDFYSVNEFKIGTRIQIFAKR